MHLGNHEARLICVVSRWYEDRAHYQQYQHESNNVNIYDIITIITPTIARGELAHARGLGRCENRGVNR